MEYKGKKLYFSSDLSLCFVLHVNVPTWMCLFQVRNGHIKRITDNDIQSLVLEIEGTNVR